MESSGHCSRPDHVYGEEPLETSFNQPQMDSRRCESAVVTLERAFERMAASSQAQLQMESGGVPLRQQTVDRARVCDHHVCQAVVAAFVGIGQLAMVETQRVKEGGVEIIDADDVLDRLVAEIVRRAMHVALSESSPGEPE